MKRLWLVNLGLLELALFLSVIALAAQLAWPGLTAWLARPRPGVLGVVSLAQLEPRYSLADECLVYLPEDYSRGENRPLVLYLHGSGDRGDDSNQVRKHGLPRYLHDGGSYPAIVAAPQCREERRWQPEDLVALVDHLLSQFAIVEDRICVVGESMGGYGTWSLAAFAPERLAAVVPLCGGGDAAAAEKMVDLAIWAFHGSEDSVVPLSASEEMVEAVNAAGGRAKLTVLDGVGHDLRYLPYENQELIDWLLGQRRDL